MGTVLLTVSPAGTGTGTVTSNPAGINCGGGGTCAAAYTSGTVVTLTAAASVSSNFGGWSGGGCSGTGSCVVTLSAATTVTATFVIKTNQLNVSVSGSGSVTSNPAGINCGATCAASFNYGTIVTLNPAAGSGQMFSSWGGACSGSGTCQVTMDQTQNVTATFVPQVFGISISKTGSSGTGTVTSNPLGINCGATCNAPYSSGTVVTLTATPDITSTFAGWSGGGCSGTGTCVVTVTAATPITALFSMKQFNLTVAPTGNGSGTITGTPGGINCGTTCLVTYNYGTMVSLTANAAMGSNFTGWGGACSGTGSCVVTMDQARNVTANFVLQTFPLNVTINGGGSGTVTSNPSGIVCTEAGGTCNLNFNYNQTVTLNASPDGINSTFNGWGGACSGTGSCVVTMDQARSVIANFVRMRIDVTHTGNGFGAVNSVPSGITNCDPSGGTCTGFFNFNQSVTLTATPNNSIQSRLSTFGGWSGACSGMGSCVVSVNSQHTVTANWILRPNYAFVTSSTTNAGFGGPGGGDMTCQSLASAAGLAGTYRALVGTSTVTPVSRLGSASGWVRVDNRPLVQSASDAANGLWMHPLRISQTNTDVGDQSAWFFSDATNCANFTTGSGAGFGTTGTTAGQGGMQLNFGGSGCAAQLRLYCFGIDRAANLPAVVPPSPRRYAFTTNASWTPGGGLASADALCQSEAVAAGLQSGTYLALLATQTASAASRFNVSGPPWVRPDGVLVAPNASIFGASLWDSAPNLSANQGTQFGNYGVWGGAINLTSVGTPASTCGTGGGAWNTTVGSNGQGGRAGYSYVPSLFGFDTTNPCSANYLHLICFQQ